MHLILPLLFLLSLVIPAASAAEHKLVREGQTLTVDLHPSLPAHRETDLLAWLTFTAEAMATVFGRWPRDQWRVEIRPGGTHTSDPVPWAQVRRGNPDRVQFYIDTMASEEKLINNWTAYHELSHLLIPYRGWGDMWFSEGLASYYQNLLQARAGVFDETDMWQRLYNGFVRGSKNRYPDLSLADLSPKLRETRSYMRVYWSGALYFLRADLALRRASDGSETLDTALAGLNRCCADASMSVWQMVQRLDDIVGRDLFVPLYRETSASLDIGDFETVFEQLGIEVWDDNVVLPASGTGWVTGG